MSWSSPRESSTRVFSVSGRRVSPSCARVSVSWRPRRAAAHLSVLRVLVRGRGGVCVAGVLLARREVEHRGRPPEVGSAAGKSRTVETVRTSPTSTTPALRSGCASHGPTHRAEAQVLEVVDGLVDEQRHMIVIQRVHHPPARAFAYH
jgi:hypothetical protein